MMRGNTSGDWFCLRYFLCFLRAFFLPRVLLKIAYLFIIYYFLFVTLIMATLSVLDSFVICTIYHAYILSPQPHSARFLHSITFSLHYIYTTLKYSALTCSTHIIFIKMLYTICVCIVMKLQNVPTVLADTAFFLHFQIIIASSIVINNCFQFIFLLNNNN